MSAARLHVQRAFPMRTAAAVSICAFIWWLPRQKSAGCCLLTFTLATSGGDDIASLCRRLRTDPHQRVAQRYAPLAFLCGFAPPPYSRALIGGQQDAISQHPARRCYRALEAPRTVRDAWPSPILRPTNQPGPRQEPEPRLGPIIRTRAAEEGKKRLPLRYPAENGHRRRIIYYIGVAVEGLRIR